MVVSFHICIHEQISLLFMTVSVSTFIWHTIQYSHVMLLYRNTPMVAFSSSGQLTTNCTYNWLTDDTGRWRVAV